MHGRQFFLKFRRNQILDHVCMDETWTKAKIKLLENDYVTKISKCVYSKSTQSSWINSIWSITCLIKSENKIHIIGEKWFPTIHFTGYLPSSLYFNYQMSRWIGTSMRLGSFIYSEQSIRTCCMHKGMTNRTQLISGPTFSCFLFSFNWRKQRVGYCVCDWRGSLRRYCWYNVM